MPTPFLPPHSLPFSPVQVRRRSYQKNTINLNFPLDFAGKITPPSYRHVNARIRESSGHLTKKEEEGEREKKEEVRDEDKEEEQETAVALGTGD